MKTFKSFYKTVGGTKGEKCYYPTRLDTYGKGCYYNCKYCYAKQLLDFRKFWHNDDVSVAPLDLIKKQIEKIPSGSVVRLGGMIDCFQPLELDIQNTYNTIKLLNEKKIHYLIVTKSNLITNEKYLNLMDKKLAHIQISIESTDNSVLNFLSNAPNFQIRKNTVETLFKEGFDTSLRLSPIIYNKTDFDEINKINVDKCLIEFLRCKPKIAKMIPFIDIEDYKVKENGYRHLELQDKLNIIDKLDFKEITVCDSVAEHYHYFKENVNYNPNDCCNLSW